jgi:hypothetical protein
MPPIGVAASGVKVKLGIERHDHALSPKKGL